jgi:predicted aspartyl protease
LKQIFKTIIDQDGFVRLPTRIHGPHKRSIKLIGIVDTGSSYTIIPPFACQLLNLPLFDEQTPEITVLTGSDYIQAPLKKATKIEILGSQIQKRNIPVLCHHIPRGVTILGHTFLKDYKATFNWKQNTFTLEETKTTKVKGHS